MCVINSAMSGQGNKRTCKHTKHFENINFEIIPNLENITITNCQKCLFIRESPLIHSFKSQKQNRILKLTDRGALYADCGLPFIINTLSPHLPGMFVPRVTTLTHTVTSSHTQIKDNFLLKNFILIFLSERLAIALCMFGENHIEFSSYIKIKILPTKLCFSKPF